MPIVSTAKFLIRYAKNPAQVGAIAPSSPALARVMIRDVDFDRASTIVEFGPGTGAFTRAIVPRLKPSTKFVAIELNPAMARDLRKRFPSVIVHERSVTDAPQILAQEGVPDQGVDVVISGLPWAAFDDALQTAILESTVRILKPGGSLITFGYQVGLLTKKGRAFHQRAREYFSSASRSEWVWANLPPAGVFTFRK
ncbi:MAG: class I SAM-dependent methyltransferase [Phycisphaerales bacterium]|jgi:phosphatidylethanolamine/phosphatidyl-N-methylethanolamine N-methyltransferase|nr:methyltransferase domain-containing protein [Phycisphaeraceae bacterium]